MKYYKFQKRFVKLHLCKDDIELETQPIGKTAFFPSLLLIHVPQVES